MSNDSKHAEAGACKGFRFFVDEASARGILFAGLNT